MENVIFRNICREIMRECHNKGIKITEKFSAYYMKLLLLNPKWNISLDNEDINRIDLQNLVKYALEQLINEDSPSVVALKMQMYFHCSFDTSQNIILRHRDNLRNKLIPLENEIITFKPKIEEAETEEELATLFKRMVYYLTLYYGLGDPTETAVYKEVYRALKSICFDSDLKEFLRLPNQYSKHDRLDELSYLLAGVRLFNRDCNKGGKGIEDIPALLTQAIDLTSNELHETLTTVMAKVNLITTALDTCFTPATRGARTVLDLRMPQNVKLESVEYAKALLVCYRQLEVYVRKMQIEIDKLDERSLEVSDDFNWCLIEVHQCVQYKTAVPASAVYPLFTKLAYTWHSLQNMVIYLSKLDQLIINLKAYMKKVIPMDEELAAMIGENNVMSDVERMGKAVEEDFELNVELRNKIMKPSEIENFDDIPLQFLGFCVWKFVESQGALIPGNPEIGVVEIDHKYYVFSRLRAAEAFVLSPKRYIYEAMDIIRRKPELAHFLGVYDQLEAVRDVRELVTVQIDTVITHAVETQTDLHPETTKKNPEYYWNIWDLKRRALAMANISKRKTHSTQTVLSNNRNAVRTQTHFTKDHHYQTKKDNYSNVPTLSNYIFGLRGRKDDRQFIITLTRPVDE